jgi:hypothetical protein
MNRDADEEVAQVINLVRMCQSYQVLPSPGGLLDQDACFIYLSQAVFNADAERALRDNERAKH